MGYRPVTSVAYPNSITYDSCKWEYSSDGISWTSLGVARGVTFTENIETSKIQTDNGPDISEQIGEHTCIISANLLEMYLPNLAAIRGGIDTVSVTSADATTDTDVYTTGSIDYGDIIWLENQGATDTLAAVSAVKSVDTGGTCTTLDSTRDYYVLTDTSNRNRRGIVLLSTASGGAFSDTEGVRVKYVYGAINSRTMSAGGLNAISAKWHRLTNAKIIGGVTKYKYITIYSGTISKGLEFAFKSANESDSVLEMPFEVMGKIDTSRSVGDQLFIIEDEQGVS